MATEMQRFLEIGEKLGFEGEGLRGFIREEQEKERVRRAEEREAKARELELEKEKVRLEKEAKAEQFELEREKIRSQEKEKANEREHQLELERLRQSGHVGVVESDDRVVRMKGPKLPYFDEEKDQIDSYIFRFERYAEAQRWDREQWSLHLSALLKGQASEVYSRLPASDATDYDRLNLALLKRFELTEEGFRKRFKESRPEKGETFVQYLSRSRNYLEKWLQLGHVERTYEDVVDYLLKDQLLVICNKELYLFLKEKLLSNSEEMAEQADLFAEARGGCLAVVNDVKDNTRRFDSRYNSNQSKWNSSFRKRNRNPHEVKCFICGDSRHKAIDCKKRFKAGGAEQEVYKVEGQSFRTDGSNNSRGISRNNRGGRWNNRGRGQCRGRGNRTDEVGGVFSNSEQVESLGSCVRVDSCPTTLGLVNGQEVTVMRDTGATCVVVKRSLVLDNQYIGEDRVCRVIDGSEHRFPVAEVKVECPYFTGKVEALVMKSPLYPLIIGSIKGATDIVKEVQAVQTRSQTCSQNKPYKKLKVPDAILDISRAEFVVLQEKDTKLEKERQKAREGNVMVNKKGGKVRFLYRNDLLYREYEYKDGRMSYQLVVPSDCRESVLKLAHESLMAGHLGRRKTADRVLTEFYWFGIMGDVTRYCRSCDPCQRTISKGRVARVPLGNMPLIDVPFNF